MNKVWSLMFLAVMSMPVCAYAQGGPPKGKCAGEWRQRTGPAGTNWLCMDGKYSTCRRDALRQGWGAERSKAYCDGLLAQGRLKK